MAPSQNQHDILLGDPIELVTRFVTNQDWLLQRRAENAVLVEVPGKWCDYQLAVTWQHNEEAMQVTAALMFNVKLTVLARSRFLPHY